LYAYVDREVTSAAARLDQFLSRNGVASDERVTVISDDVGEFSKTVQGSQLARGRILDWFHIVMKFQATQRSVFGSKMIGSLKRESVETEITHAKWLVWQGKGSKAVERIKALDARLLTRERYKFSTLWWNLNTVCGYLRNNAHTLVNYGARHRKGLPISSSIAESAVVQVVSHRMAKKQQMRLTGEGAHCMVQVMVAVLSGEFSPRRISELEIAASRHGKCIGAASQAGTDQRTEQTMRRCSKPGRPNEIDLPNFRTLSYTGDEPEVHARYRESGHAVDYRGQEGTERRGERMAEAQPGRAYAMAGGRKDVRREGRAARDEVLPRCTVAVRCESDMSRIRRPVVHPAAAGAATRCRITGASHDCDRSRLGGQPNFVL
jgi:hypothetical protein